MLSHPTITVENVAELMSLATALGMLTLLKPGDPVVLAAGEKLEARIGDLLGADAVRPVMTLHGQHIVEMVFPETRVAAASRGMGRC